MDFVVFKFCIVIFNMILALTGTPGTGKTSVADALGEKTGWRVIHLNQLAQEKDLYSGYDEERECKVVDMKALEKEVKKQSKLHNLIIEAHYSHSLPCDVVIALRTSPEELRERMKEKGWKKEKVEENILSEIMEVCNIESLEEGKKTIEMDTTGKEPEEVVEGIIKQLKKITIEI